MTTDLTTGKVSKVILTFALPLLLSTVLQQFYNVADSIIVGQFTGAGGLAAIGAAYPITLFFIAIATGASMGCSVIISQIFGAKRLGDMKQAVTTSLVSFVVLGIVLAVGGALLAGPLMHLLNAQEDIFADARAYLLIYAIGAFPMLVYNATTGIFTGLGDSKLPLLLLCISSVLNVILDYIAVKFLLWGVIGAAWATTFSQFVAALLSIIILVKRLKKICPVESRGGFSSVILKDITKAAIPCILQQSCVAITHTIVQSILNTYDTAIIAGYEAASKLHNFAYMGMNTIGSAFATFTAQCYGAKKHSRIKEGFRVTVITLAIITACIILLFQILPNQLIGIFIDGDAAPLVIESGTNYLRIISPVYSIICFIIATGGLLRGVGNSLAFFIETMIEFCVRVTMCFVLTSVLASYTGLMWAWYFGSTVGFLMCLGLTIKTFKKKLSSERLEA
ncbi:MAG: MATE family efflux transporter [Oscillospiraceae bacterium]|nr:MATE family efflux transporter [Oscillospiraceae bacterium]